MQILKLLQCNCVNNNSSVDLQHYVDLIESVYTPKVTMMNIPILNKKQMDELSKIGCVGAYKQVTTSDGLKGLK